MKFQSKFMYLGMVGMPAYSGIRVMMMPIILDDMMTIPDKLKPYWNLIHSMFGLMNKEHRDKVGYITIDERVVKAGETHRRAGLHVDGVYRGEAGSWGGGDGGWGAPGTGMLTVSNIIGCKAYNQEFDGTIGRDGECDSLAQQCDESKATLFQSGALYWVDGLCVHESIPMTQTSKRQFVRLSMPSKAPWFEGYDVNPRGILPSGPVLSRRKYMDLVPA